MNLHRVIGKSDWGDVLPAKRTQLQKLAARTGSIVTPANVVTLLGLILVVGGAVAVLQGDLWMGAGLLVVGRLLDLADGAVADATQTKSRLGEVLDATADKIGTFVTIAAFIAASLVPVWVVVSLLLPQLLVPLVVGYQRRRGVDVQASREGKVSMALTWAGIIGLLAVAILGVPPALTALVYTICLLSLLLGMYALWQYTSERG